jgi:hypothetical protein
LSLQHLPISIMGEVVGVYCIVDNIKKFQHWCTYKKIRANSTPKLKG